MEVNKTGKIIIIILAIGILGALVALTISLVNMFKINNLDKPTADNVSQNENVNIKWPENVNVKEAKTEVTFENEESGKVDIYILDGKLYCKNNSGIKEVKKYEGTPLKVVIQYSENVNVMLLTSKNKLYKYVYSDGIDVPTETIIIATGVASMDENAIGFLTANGELVNVDGNKWENDDINILLKARKAIITTDIANFRNECMLEWAENVQYIGADNELLLDNYKEILKTNYRELYLRGYSVRAAENGAAELIEPEY